MKYVGIDLHTNRFTCCFLDEEGHKRIKTFVLNKKDIALFLDSVDVYKTRVLVEATVNTFAFTGLIKDHVKEVIVANTFELKNISFTSKKTDKVDAYKLARNSAISFLFNSNVLILLCPSSSRKQQENPI